MDLDVFIITGVCISYSPLETYVILGVRSYKRLPYQNQLTFRIVLKFRF